MHCERQKAIDEKPKGLNMCLPFVLPPRPTTQPKLPNEYQIDLNFQCNDSVVYDPKRDKHRRRENKRHICDAEENLRTLTCCCYRRRRNARDKIYPGNDMLCIEDYRVVTQWWTRWKYQKYHPAHQHQPTLVSKYMFESCKQPCVGSFLKFLFLISVIFSFIILYLKRSSHRIHLYEIFKYSTSWPFLDPLQIVVICSLRGWDSVDEEVESRALVLPNSVVFWID